MILLDAPRHQTQAEVSPAHGFNCLRWRVGGRDLLYVAPDWDANPVPTRSGVPILFPFPNRIRDGRFSWDGRDFTLPANDPAKRNAIHGFTPRRPWRVVERGGDFVRGEFQISVDAPDCRALWPADARLRVTYRLGPSSLRIEAVVENPDRVPLPFGLGYHPYFRVDGESDTIEVPARSTWELVESLPTGVHLPAAGVSNLNQPRPLAGRTFDDVYTDLTGSQAADGLCLRGRVTTASGALELWAGPDFREMVVFAPPHRQAVALEPYTCVTDAVHLQARGVEAGWRTLAPGAHWAGVVEFLWRPT